MSRSHPRSPGSRPLRRRVPRLEALEDRLAPAMFTVTSTADSGTGSLRAAILSANGAPGANQVEFQLPPGPNTIQLTSGVLQITGSLEIDGPGASLLTVQGNSTAGIFQVAGSAPTTVSINGLTITGGKATDGGGVQNAQTLTLANDVITANAATLDGGGVYNSGTLTVTGCTISLNTVPPTASTSGGGGLFNANKATVSLTGTTVSGNKAGNGGGIESQGVLTASGLTVSNNAADLPSPNGGGLAVANSSGHGGAGPVSTTVSNSVFSGNTATNGFGGAISWAGQGTLTGLTVMGNSAKNGGGISGFDTLSNSTVANNTATSDGGGLYGQIFLGGLASTGDTFSGNMAATGGGIYMSGGLALTNATVAGNTATAGGGGIAISGSLSLTQVTVEGNTAPSGGGVLAISSSSLLLTNSIIAGSTGPDVTTAGPVTTQGGNLVQDGSVTGASVINANPLLSPLGNYGGPTQTTALLPGSPAIDAGVNAYAVDASGNPLTTDQRGLPRIFNGAVDIGAFESGGFTIAVTSGGGQATTILTAFPAPLIATVTANNPGEPVAGGLVAFTPPSSAASATLTGSPATISTAGTASVSATANGIAGSYTVAATAKGITTPVSFGLTNTPAMAVASTQTIPALANIPSGSVLLATFTVQSGTTLSAANFSGSIDWQDSSPLDTTTFGVSVSGGQVQVYGGHTYTAAGQYRPVVTLTFLATQTSVTARPTLNVATNVSGAVSTLLSGPSYNRTDKRYHDTLTIKNTSAAAIAGSLRVVLSALTAGVSLANVSVTINGVTYSSATPGSGITITTGGAGEAVINISSAILGQLAAGQSLVLSNAFSDPSGVAFGCTAMTYADPYDTF